FVTSRVVSPPSWHGPFGQLAGAVKLRVVHRLLPFFDFMHRHSGGKSVAQALKKLDS
ncbi:MAG: hypothetical protein ACI9MC_000639, partial [Kiritimatiellia bacterium]